MNVRVEIFTVPVRVIVHASPRLASKLPGVIKDVAFLDLLEDGQGYLLAGQGEGADLDGGCLDLGVLHGQLRHEAFLPF